MSDGKGDGLDGVDPYFRRFQKWEFEFGEDLPWSVDPRQSKARWDQVKTSIIWTSAWRMLLPLMRREGVSEIMVKSASEIWVETRDGFILTSLSFDPEVKGLPEGWDPSWRVPTREDLLKGLKFIHEENTGKSTWNEIAVNGDVHVEANLEDGSRLMGLLPPCSTTSDVNINIRRFKLTKLTTEQLIEGGSLTREAADTLRMAVFAHQNMLFAAGTGAGKTTLLEWVCSFIPHHEAPLTIEDTPELNIDHPLYRGFKTRERPNDAGAEFQAMNMTNLLTASLRARPDWIIPGEIRDSSDPQNVPAEAFINAIQSGHHGACTIHAHDAYGALMRLESMLRTARPNSNDFSIRNSICEAVNLVVVLRRHQEVNFLPDGTKVYRPRRRVYSITEVLGGTGDSYFLHDLFVTRFKERVHANGMVTMEPGLEMINIPFFGLELKDQGFEMPEWWDGAQLEYQSMIPAVGRAKSAERIRNLPV